MENRLFSVAILSSPFQLHTLCLNHGLQLSQQSNETVIRDLIRKLGLKRAERIMKKLVNLGELNEETVEYEVEEILKKRHSHDSQEYLVKWKNWPSSYNTWEPESHLVNAMEILNEFKASKRKKRRAIGCSQTTHPSEEEKFEDIFTQIQNCNRQFTANSLLELTQTQVPPSLLQLHIPKPKPKARATNRKCKTYKKHKAYLAEALNDWAKKINLVTPSYPPILMENKVDLEGPPAKFEFIKSSIKTAGVGHHYKSSRGCTCKICHANNEEDASFAYTIDKRVDLQPLALNTPGENCGKGSPIYECNQNCLCPKDCLNRVVQLGRRVKLTIFRTVNGIGWGVKAGQKIKKGTFIMEYIGEIITNEEADRRSSGFGTNYQFALSSHGKEHCPLTIDAINYGNESHFVNHSCDPNMAVHSVWIENACEWLPRIALFANRNISTGEELTYDYEMTITDKTTGDPEIAQEADGNSIEGPENAGMNLTTTDTSTPVDLMHASTRRSREFSCEHHRIVCRCGAKKCRGYLF